MCTGLCNIKIKGSVSSTIVLSKHDEYECDEYNADIEKCIEDGMRPKGKVTLFGAGGIFIFKCHQIQAQTKSFIYILS